MTKLTNDEYRNAMDFPMQILAEVLDPEGNHAGMADHDIVERATKKILTMKKMLLVIGLNPKLLDAIMEE